MNNMTHQQYLDLQKLIDIGEELNFKYKGNEYWISNTPDNKHHLTRVSDAYTQTFDNPKTLFKKGKIDGHHFGDIYHDISWDD